MNHFTIHLIESQVKLRDDLSDVEKTELNQKICAVKASILKLFHRKDYFTKDQDSVKKGIEHHKYMKKNALEELDDIVPKLTL